MADDVLSRLLLLFGADTSDVQREMTSVDRIVKGVRTELTKTRSVTNLLAGAAGFGFLAKSTFELGATVGETASKFGTVFGEAQDEVQGFIDSFGTVAGLSNEQAQAVLATTGSIVQGLGFAQDASASFSTTAIQLAGDLASFNNVPIEQTSRAISSALTGEREQLKQLGIVLREADVQQRALEMSGKAAASALTDQERATATLQLITERAGVAVGDLARTQESAANQARALGAEIQNLKEDLAVALVPAFRTAVDWAMRFIGGIKLLGVDAAVALAKFRVSWVKTFGDDEAFADALDNLHRTSEAARIMRLEIVGLGDEIGGLSAGLSGSGGGGGSAPLAPAIGEVANRLVSVQGPAGAAISIFESLKLTASGLGSEVEDLGFGLKDLTGIFGRAASIASIFGGLGPVAGLLGKGSGLLSSFGGFFADGGHIPGGKFGVVGERGPELVRGPAQVTPAGGGLSLSINVPPAPNPAAAARDPQWVRAVTDAVREAMFNGFNPAAP